eukprot:IDg18731t1
MSLSKSAVFIALLITAPCGCIGSAPTAAGASQKRQTVYLVRISAYISRFIGSEVRVDFAIWILMGSISLNVVTTFGIVRLEVYHNFKTSTTRGSKFYSCYQY